MIRLHCLLFDIGFSTSYSVGGLILTRLQSVLDLNIRDMMLELIGLPDSVQRSLLLFPCDSVYRRKTNLFMISTFVYIFLFCTYTCHNTCQCVTGYNYGLQTSHTLSILFVDFHYAICFITSYIDVSYIISLPLSSFCLPLPLSFGVTFPFIIAGSCKNRHVQKWYYRPSLRLISILTFIGSTT